MVLNKEKLIFIHIPKTGGISIEEYLQSYYGYERNAFIFNHGYGTYLANNNSGKYTIYPHMHYPLQYVVKELKKNNIKVDNSWNIFSIVRNPYNKLISALFYDEKLSLKYNYFTLPENQRSYYLNKALTEYQNSDINFNYHSNHSCPQYKFFENTDLNYKIFKFELGLKNILGELGYDNLDSLPHKLNTFVSMGVEKPPYETLYTNQFVDYVNQTYSKDFEMFGYEMLDPNIYPLII